MSRDPAKFAAFILTHGRPDNVRTHRSLRRAGYTGRIVLVVDDQDPTLPAYRERFGDEVETFSKAEIAPTFDAADLSPDRRTIVYARLASYQIAERLGLDYLLQLDDDYNWFAFRFGGRPGALSRGGTDGMTQIRSFDRVVAAMLELLESTGALTVAFAQGGDLLGGLHHRPTDPARETLGNIRRGYKRKAMNSFFVRVDRPVRFVGRLNEDVNAYCLWGSRGEIFLTVAAIQLDQQMTQQGAGGMSDVYLASGTYVKSFYSVMMCPSFVSIHMMGEDYRRLHHRVSWDNAVPKIVGPEYRRIPA